jgi:uncharacterized protein (DUF433 family)/DNA-binding transcriptional MerR regulator
VAYPTDITATLSGASLRQLAYWRRPKDGVALLAPELGDSGGRLLYSFRDLIALRTFVYLREQLPLQRIRKAVASLRDLGSTDHLSHYRLFASGKSVVWQAPDDDTFVDLVEQPGALRLAAIMADVMRPFKDSHGRSVVDLVHPRPNIEIDPEVQGGYPVIRGTRIEFDLVASLVEDGMKPSEVKSIYPSVSAAGARDAARFAELVRSYRDPVTPRPVENGRLHAAAS